MPDVLGVAPGAKATDVHAEATQWPCDSTVVLSSPSDPPSEPPEPPEPPCCDEEEDSAQMDDAKLQRMISVPSPSAMGRPEEHYLVPSHLITAAPSEKVGILAMAAALQARNPMTTKELKEDQIMLAKAERRWRSQQAREAMYTKQEKRQENTCFYTCMYPCCTCIHMRTTTARQDRQDVCAAFRDLPAYVQ